MKKIIISVGILVGLSLLSLSIMGLIYAGLCWAFAWHFSVKWLIGFWVLLFLINVILKKHTGETLI